MREARAQGIVIFAAILAAVAACGRKGPERPAREAVTPLLQREAEDLKLSGEKLDPVLRVKATWTIAGIDVTDRPGDADRPWAGTIALQDPRRNKGHRRRRGGRVRAPLRLRLQGQREQVDLPARAFCRSLIVYGAAERQ